MKRGLPKIVIQVKVGLLCGRLVRLCARSVRIFSVIWPDATATGRYESVDARERSGFSVEGQRKVPSGARFVSSRIFRAIL